MSDDADGAEADGESAGSLDATVAQFLRDVDAAHEDYERGYTDADATLSVVMSHVDRLREDHESRGEE